MFPDDIFDDSEPYSLTDPFLGASVEISSSLEAPDSQQMMEYNNNNNEMNALKNADAINQNSADLLNLAAQISKDQTIGEINFMWKNLKHQLKTKSTLKKPRPNKPHMKILPKKLYPSPLDEEKRAVESIMVEEEREETGVMSSSEIRRPTFEEAQGFVLKAQRVVCYPGVSAKSKAAKNYSNDMRRMSYGFMTSLIDQCFADLDGPPISRRDLVNYFPTEAEYQAVVKSCAEMPKLGGGNSKGNPKLKKKT